MATDTQVVKKAMFLLKRLINFNKAFETEYGLKNEDVGVDHVNDGMEWLSSNGEPRTSDEKKYLTSGFESQWQNFFAAFETVQEPSLHLVEVLADLS